MGRKGKTYGTPGYAAPEQYLGAAGPDSDVYGLGRLLQELLPKKRARGLHRIVRKSVRKEREKRFHTAEEFRVALEKWERRNRRTGKAFTVTAVLSAAVLVMGWRISEEVRELQYQEALRMGRGTGDSPILWSGYLPGTGAGGTVPGAAELLCTTGRGTAGLLLRRGISGSLSRWPGGKREDPIGGKACLLFADAVILAL